MEAAASTVNVKPRENISSTIREEESEAKEMEETISTTILLPWMASFDGLGRN